MVLTHHVPRKRCRRSHTHAAETAQNNSKQLCTQGNFKPECAKELMARCKSNHYGMHSAKLRKYAKHLQSGRRLTMESRFSKFDSLKVPRWKCSIQTPVATPPHHHTTTPPLHHTTTPPHRQTTKPNLPEPLHTTEHCKPLPKQDLPTPERVIKAPASDSPPPQAVPQGVEGGKRIEGHLKDTRKRVQTHIMTIYTGAKINRNVALN
jgi:hypothetical protein